MFDTEPNPLNAEQPARVPLKPQGRIPVIARLVWPDRIDYVPARAIRWTSGHVMILWTPNENLLSKELTVWLPAEDVTRRLSSPRARMATPEPLPSSGRRGPYGPGSTG